jgi:hypothetical protein
MKERDDGRLLLFPLSEEEGKDMRDDFSNPVKELLAKRVGYRCSNPDCGQATSGPQVDPQKVVNVGVAAHITAASPDGPRYDASLTSEQRKAAENGLWLCQKCGKLVDNDAGRYTVEKLQEWKSVAEETAIRELEGGPQRAASPQVTAAVLIQGPNAININGPNAVHLGPNAIKIQQNVGAQGARLGPFAKLEKMMPELLAEMKTDLKQHPLSREFVLLGKRSSSYWPGGEELMYYAAEHLNLESKIRILQNYGLVEQITFNEVKRFVFTEAFVDYLTGQ